MLGIYVLGAPVLGRTGSQKPSDPGGTLVPETDRARPSETFTAGRDRRPLLPAADGVGMGLGGRMAVRPIGCFCSGRGRGIAGRVGLRER